MQTVFKLLDTVATREILGGLIKRFPNGPEDDYFTFRYKDISTYINNSWTSPWVKLYDYGLIRIINMHEHNSIVTFDIIISLKGIWFYNFIKKKYKL